jgi:hypothetical protein
MRLLLEYGADPRAVDSSGDSAISMLERSDRGTGPDIPRATRQLMWEALRAAQQRSAAMPASKSENSISARRDIVEQPAESFICEETQFDGLTTSQGAALKYVIEQEIGNRRERYCIVSIESMRQFPLRGNTVVEYVATFHFPIGYAVDCLERDRQVGQMQQGFTGWDNWMSIATSDCSVNPIRYFPSAYEPGASVRIHGTEEI